jgi:hypothetical protein
MSTKRFTRDDLIEALHKLAGRVDRTPIEYDTYDYLDIAIAYRWAARTEGAIRTSEEMGKSHRRPNTR